jgi:hypothetical protein
MKHLRSKFTYANVMATIAVFIALGGASYAATRLPKNSVGAKQLKKGAVTPTKLSSSAMASLTGEAGAKGDTGAPGATGATGAQGIPGEDGAPATDFFAQVKPEGTVNASGSAVTVDHYGDGLYLVNFGRDVTHCAAIVNEGGVPVFSSPGTSTGSPPGDGADVVIGSPKAPEGEFAPGFPFAETILVATYSGAAEHDASFYIAVFC